MKSLEKFLPREIATAAELFDGTITEIRMTKNAPLFISSLSGNFFITAIGEKTDAKNALTVSESLFSETVRRITDFSYYAHESEIERGVITLPGGHRVGLSGRGKEKDGKTVLSEIFSLNFRVARTVDGACDAFFSALSSPLKNAVILSPPGKGKTTALRDIAKRLSLSAIPVSLIDCRGELSFGNGSFYSCDVIERFNKRDGISHALSCLSPRVIVCDEITLSEEVSDIAEGMNSGVKFIVSAHAENFAEAKKRPVTAALFSLFDVAIFLGPSPGELKEVIFLD